MSAKVIKGDDVNLVVTLKDSSGNIFDLTDYNDVGDSIEVFLEGHTNNVTVAGSISGSPEAGKVSFTLTNANTEALKTGKVTVEIVLDNEAHDAGARKTAQIKNAIEVLERICS